MGLPTTSLPSYTRNFYNPVFPGASATPTAGTMPFLSYPAPFPAMNFPPKLFQGPPPPPGPVIVGYRPVYANTGTQGGVSESNPDQFIPTATGSAAADTANRTDTFSPSPTLESEDSMATPDTAPANTAPQATPDTTTDGSAAPTRAQNATAQTGTQATTPATYEEEIGDRVTKILQRNPELTTRLKGWEQTLDAKGLDLETLANDPQQMMQELISDPNSIVGQNLDEFRQTKTYKLVYHFYKLVPKPLKKLFIKILPQKYKSIAEQTLNTLFEEPPSAATSSSGKKSKHHKTSSSAPDGLASSKASSPDLSALLGEKDSEAPAHAALS